MAIGTRTKKVVFVIDELICKICHNTNPLHSRALKTLKNKNKKISKLKTKLLILSLNTQQAIHTKIIYKALNKLHKLLKTILDS